MNFELSIIAVLVIIITLLYFLKDKILGLISSIKPKDEAQAAQLQKVSEGIEKASEGAKILGDGVTTFGKKVFEESRIATDKALEFAKSDEAKSIATQIKSGVISGFDTVVDYTEELLSGVCAGGMKTHGHKHRHEHHRCKKCGRVNAQADYSIYRPQADIVLEGVVNEEWLLQNA